MIALLQFPGKFDTERISENRPVFDECMWRVLGVYFLAHPAYQFSELGNAVGPMVQDIVHNEQFC